MLAVVAAAAPAATVPVVAVGEPWVRPGVARASTEAYLELSTSEPMTLVGARSPAAAAVAIRAAGAPTRTIAMLPLPAGAKVRLAPGAHRLALAGLLRPLALGERVSITLLLEAPDGSRREIPVDAEVRRRSPTDDERRAHGRAH